MKNKKPFNRDLLIISLTCKSSILFITGTGIRSLTMIKDIPRWFEVLAFCMGILLLVLGVVFSIVYCLGILAKSQLEQKKAAYEMEIKEMKCEFWLAYERENCHMGVRAYENICSQLKFLGLSSAEVDEKINKEWKEIFSIYFYKSVMELNEKYNISQQNLNEMFKEEFAVLPDYFMDTLRKEPQNPKEEKSYEE